MTMGFSTDLRNDRAKAIRDRIDAALSPGRLRFYDGVRPATNGAVTNLLADVPLSDPSAPDPAGGVLTLTTPVEDSAADASGTTTWARIVDGDGNFVMDLSVTVTDGGGDIQLVDVNLVAGQPVRITSATITEGNA